MTVTIQPPATAYGDRSGAITFPAVEDTRGVCALQVGVSDDAAGRSTLGRGVWPEEISGRVKSSGAEQDPIGRPHESVPTQTTAPSRAARPRETDASVARANGRLAILQCYAELRAAGSSERAAARALGERGLEVSPRTIKEWAQRYAEQGYNGLLGLHHLSGRTSAVDRLSRVIGPEAAEQIWRDAQGVNLDVKSGGLSMRLLSASRNAPTALTELVHYREDGRPRKSKHYLPKSIKDRIATSEALRRRHQGNRASDLGGLYTPRTLDVLPGDVWTSDDTTPIWGWWVPWAHALGNPAYPTASCEYRFGVKLLQGQLLPLMDVASNYIFSLALIARETAGYRAADIWALFGRAFSNFGLPRLGFQLERGSWEANLIRGAQVIVQVGEHSLERRVGGLRMLPTHITAAHRAMHGADFPFPKTLQTWTSFLPKSKPIEAAFNRLQAVEGMLWGTPGRDQMRRPNEAAKKLLGACQRGALDPREHFLSGPELIARLVPLYDFINSERMEGRVFRGVPQHQWEASLREHPLYRMPEERQHLFRRNWQVARVHRGLVGLKRQTEFDTATTDFYCHPERFPALEGKQIIAYWDPEDLATPAYIHTLDHEYLCAAEYQEPPGMFLDVSSHGHENRRRYRNALTTLYADLGARAPSRQVPEEILARRAAAAGGPPAAGRMVAAEVRTNLPSYTAKAAPAAPLAPLLEDRNSAASDPRLADFA